MLQAQSIASIFPCKVLRLPPPKKKNTGYSTTVSKTQAHNLWQQISSGHFCSQSTALHWRLPSLGSSRLTLINRMPISSGASLTAPFVFRPYRYRRPSSWHLSIFPEQTPCMSARQQKRKQNKKTTSISQGKISEKKQQLPEKYKSREAWED